jgi:hypothetical protein
MMTTGNRFIASESCLCRRQTNPSHSSYRGGNIRFCKVSQSGAGRHRVAPESRG